MAFEVCVGEGRGLHSKKAETMVLGSKAMSELGCRFWGSLAYLQHVNYKSWHMFLEKERNKSERKESHNITACLCKWRGQFYILAH